MDITHDNVCSSMLSCFYSHLLSTGRPISSSLSITINFVRIESRQEDYDFDTKVEKRTPNA